MNSTVIEKNKNNDVIEFLELNDIKSGLMKVDYYQSDGLDLNLYYWVVLAFNRKQLIILVKIKEDKEKKLLICLIRIKNMKLIKLIKKL